MGDPDYTGERECGSRWGIGFSQSDQFYLVSLPMT
jgi:hypothetical protein